MAQGDGPVSALVVIDVIDTFRHPGGDELLACLERRADRLEAAIRDARARDMPVIYVNDNRGRWDGDAPALVREAVREGRAGSIVARIAPAEGDRFVLKPSYSGFEHTPLAPLLRSLDVERVVLMGAATEMCVRDTAIDATRQGFSTAVLRDACLTTDPELERIALESLARLVDADVVEGLAAAVPAGRPAPAVV